MLKVVIIEDEEYTAKDLAETIRKVDHDIETVIILSSVEEATEYLKSHTNFDLIFSDIQLPDGLSFEIFKAVKINVPVIFCTAYDQYALEAFDANGIDYLLKPFNKVSVSKALDKYMALTSKKQTTDSNFNDLLQKLDQHMNRQTHSIIIHKGDKILPLEISQIGLFYIEDESVFALTFDSKKYILTQKLEELEQICGKSFFRANRQHLINRSAIIDASKYFNRKVLVNIKLDFPEQILVGKLKVKAFMDWLANH